MSRHTIRYPEILPEPFQKQLDLSMAVHKSGIGPRLLELVFLRVSQVNGCAFCIDMHVRNLLAAGEDLQRIALLPAWRESDCYNARERAALDWAEKVNALHDDKALDASFALLDRQFSEREIAELTFAVAVIRTWNTLNVSLRTPVERKPLAA
ncbi:MAG TPA: carboxymuconolactone decarboxylase family protein [Gammaproteobacteria bacterium]